MAIIILSILLAIAIAYGARVAYCRKYDWQRISELEGQIQFHQGEIDALQAQIAMPSIPNACAHESLPVGTILMVGPTHILSPLTETMAPAYPSPNPWANNVPSFEGVLASGILVPFGSGESVVSGAIPTMTFDLPEPKIYMQPKTEKTLDVPELEDRWKKIAEEG